MKGIWQMRSCFGVFLFLVLVLPMMLGALCMVAINTWIFDRDYYLDTFDNIVLYEAFLADMPDYLNLEMFKREFASSDQKAEAENALVMAFKEVITPEYMRNETLSAINDVFAVVDNPDASTQISVNLVYVKDALAGEQGNIFARTLADNLPSCQSGQEPRASGDTLISCISNNMSQAEAVESIQRSLPRFIEDIPDELFLNDAIDGDFAPINGISLRAAFRTWLLNLGGFTLIFWIAVAFIAGKGMRGRLFWMGGMLLVAGGVILVMALNIDNTWIPAAETALHDSELTINQVQASAQLRDALSGVMSIAFERISTGFTMVGAVSAGVALFLLLLGSRARRSDSDDYQPTVTIPYGLD